MPQMAAYHQTLITKVAIPCQNMLIDYGVKEQETYLLARLCLYEEMFFIVAYDKHLAISVDSGETYINYDHAALLNASESFIRAIITASDTCLMLTNEGRLFRST